MKTVIVDRRKCWHLIVRPLTMKLLESRLFGFKKGAFTGAHKDTHGLFHEANGSTIFLDEIGDITPYMQKSLLRVIQEHEILPVGAREPEKVNVRVIAATNKDLRELCKAERFRWDLYYRLSYVELYIPSLAEQGRAAIQQMIDFLLRQKAQDFKKEILKLQPNVHEALLSYSWPGNIREMDNLISRFYIYCQKEVRSGDLPPYIWEQQSDNNLSWKEAERRHLIKVLSLTGGSRKEALKLLEYHSYNTLLSKIRKYKIDELINTSD